MGELSERPPPKPFVNPLLMFTYPDVFVLLVFNGMLCRYVWCHSKSIGHFRERISLPYSSGSWPMFPRHRRRNGNRHMAFRQAYQLLLPEDSERHRPPNSIGFGEEHRSQSPRTRPNVPARKGEVKSITLHYVPLHRLCCWLRLGSRIEGHHCGTSNLANHQ